MQGGAGLCSTICCTCAFHVQIDQGSRAEACYQPRCCFLPHIMALLVLSNLMTSYLANVPHPAGTLTYLRLKQFKVAKILLRGFWS
jgi:hypothetical protein